MALVQKRMSKQRLAALSVVLGLFLIVSGYLVYTNYFEPVTVEPPPTGPYRVNDLPIVRDLGDDVVTDSRFIELVPHGQLPVQPGASGRDNPFVAPGF